jgi:hypothetical protein
MIMLIGVLILISSCKSQFEDEKLFPNIKNVIELEKTDLIPTFESSFEINKNNIYVVTLILAWNDIKNEIGAELTAFSSEQLEEINLSKSHLNTLQKNEYESSIEVDGRKISTNAYFRKSLQFEKPLTKFEDPILFGNTKVESFGFWGNCEFAKVNYYTDENEYSITLFPKNKEHEIILIMNQGLKYSLNNFQDYFSRYNQQKDLKKNEAILLNNKDKIVIPIIQFNLEKTFEKIVRSTFKGNNLEFEVVEAKQQNAFILNEGGAEVESLVEMISEASEEMVKPHPKLMIFNKPFVVFLKRKDASHPYFGIYVVNDELLKRSK